MGQSADYSYVPRIAVAGVMPNFNANPGASDNYLYLAGTITVGQDKSSQDTNNVKRSVQPSGQNFIPGLPLTATATTENSVDPLTVFGTAFDIGSLMNLSATTSGHEQEYTMAMSNGMYYDTNQFAGYQGTDKYLGSTGTSDSRAGRDLNQGATQVTVTPSTVVMPNDFVYGEARNTLLPTINMGYALKAASGLVGFSYRQSVLGSTSSEVTNGYAFQLGGATIAFVAPRFDTASLVYRQPAM